MTGPPANNGMTRGRDVRAAVRRWGWPGAVALLVVVAALVTTLMVPDTTRAELDPRSTSADGTRALAQILRRHGVRVDLVRHVGDAVAEGADGATIVVVDSDLLGPDQLDRLAASGADLVLVEPDLITLRALTDGVVPAGQDDAATASPACADPDALAAGDVTGGGEVLRIAGGTAATVGCYPGVSGDVSVVRQHRTDHEVTVLGQSAVLENDLLAARGNAALAVRVLGARAVVRWYLPDPLDATASAAPSTLDLVPPWVRWGFWQLLLAVVITLIWRARRPGQVVTEPLPVVVRAAETEQGRARLYRAGRSRGHAAAVLRTAALRRLALRLGIPSGAPPQDVARAAADAAGCDPAPALADLLGPSPRDDAALVTLAHSLDALEHAVTAGRPGTVGATSSSGAAAPPSPGAAAPPSPGAAAPPAREVRPR